MKKMKLIAFLMAAAMTVLAGCGGSTGQEGGADKQASQTTAGQESSQSTGEVQEIDLKVWCPQNQVDTKIMEQQQAKFQEEHPEWKINWITEVVGEDKAQESILKDVSAAADVFFFANDQLPDLEEKPKLW